VSQDYFVFDKKMDLGACPKSHAERLKTEFLAAKEENPNDPIFNRFQMEYESNIFALVDDCDRRIRAAHRRLEKTPEENAKTTNLVNTTLTLFIFWLMQYANIR
jgi:LUC7 N_terminus